jgi:hypothetical protein
MLEEVTLYGTYRTDVHVMSEGPKLQQKMQHGEKLGSAQGIL